MFIPIPSSITVSKSSSNINLIKDARASYAFLTNTSNYRGASFTNSLGRMIHTAMSRVQEWPQDRDLFVEVPRPDTVSNEPITPTDNV
ncbi:MAG: hypothetical protein IKA96_07220 [Alistipes sp.]|nr:hypothetical protein [Alistipes sp.]